MLSERIIEDKQKIEGHSKISRGNGRSPHRGVGIQAAIRNSWMSKYNPRMSINK